MLRPWLLLLPRPGRCPKALRDTGELTQEYLNYLFLTKWNGTLPQVMGGATPMIDVSQYLPGADTP